MDRDDCDIRIGIVDDHAFFRDGVRLMLQRSKEPSLTIVFECENGKDALLKLQENPVDILLMDIQMPVMDGIEATRYISKHYSNVKVIGLSSFSEDFPVTEMIQAGAKGFLLKNAPKPELLNAVVEVAAGRTFFPAATEASDAKITGEARRNIETALTCREIEIIQLICLGKSSLEIGEALFISKRTVDGHRDRIMQKTGCRNLAELLLYATYHHLHRGK